MLIIRLSSLSSISVFCAPDKSGVAIQHIPSYRVLFLPSKYESLVKTWRDSVSFPSIPELNWGKLGLTDDDVSEFRILLTENNLID